MTASEVDRRFAERLRRLRRARGMTGVELAAAAGMPEQAVYRIEAGTSPTPRRATVGEAAALAAALGVDLAHLVAEDVLRVTVALGRSS
jgi:transcriptional regulator with XRE-family HTH domain